MFYKESLMLDNKVTVVITSYNRFDFLKQTLDSFLILNNFPYDRLVVIEDSTNLEMKSKISNTYGNRVELIFNDVNLGQPASIDKAYKTVDTQYIFHSEDDYFYTGNSNFIQNSMDILKERPDVHQIWLRHIDNYFVSHGAEGSKQFEDQIHQTSTNVAYKMLKLPHCGNWCGFSWNPGLRRTEDYNRLFPNGYAFHVKSEKGAYAEYNCNIHAMANGYRAALLINGACNNMGQDFSTFK
jgi:GT2 family glycosyltransferase